MWIETFDWARKKKLLHSILPGQTITCGRSKDSRSKWFRLSGHGLLLHNQRRRDGWAKAIDGRGAPGMEQLVHRSTQKKCGQSLVFPSSPMRKASETIDLLRVYLDETIPLNALSLPIDSQPIIQHEELEENSPKSRYNAAATLRKKYSSWIQTIHLIFTVFFLDIWALQKFILQHRWTHFFSWWFVLFTFSPWTMQFIYSEMVIFQLSGRVYNTLNLVSELIPVKLTRGAVHRNLTVRIASGKL